MAIRVTMHTTANLVNFYINRNYKKLEDIYEVVASNKRINRPSDDPTGAGKVLDYREYIARADQFLRNTQNGLSPLSTVESTLSQSSDILVQAKETALEMSSGTMTEDERETAATEIETLIHQLLGLANSQHLDNYLFSGTEVTTAPFELDDTGPVWTVTFMGDNEAIDIQINDALTQTINIDGEEVFMGSVGGATTGTDLFETLINLRDALLADDIEAVQAEIDNLDAGHNQLLNARADVGLRINNLNKNGDRLELYIINLTEQLSFVEDADSIKAIEDLTLAEVTMQATLQTATLISQITILNYL